MPFPLPDADLAAFAGAVLGFQLGDVGFELFEVVDAVVADAKGADFAGLLGFDEGVPGAEAGGAAAVGGMDEVAVVLASVLRAIGFKGLIS